MSFSKRLRSPWTSGALGACLLLGSAAGAQQQPSPPVQQALALGVDTKNFDKSVRPQDDFYRYVNGTWLKTAQIPADRARYGTFIELADKSEAALRALIEEAASAKGAQARQRRAEGGRPLPELHGHRAHRGRWASRRCARSSRAWRR